MTAEPAAVETEGTEYAAYVAKLLDRQDTTKTSLETRGLAVITTSGTLVTLVFGLTALLTKAGDYELPSEANPWIGGALAAFVAAAVLGLAVNWPRSYDAPDFDDSKTVLDVWADAASGARRRVTATRLKEYRKAQRVNGQKARLLAAAMTAQVLAVSLLCTAVGVVIDKS